MNAINVIKERRSVRKFKNEKVDRATMAEIVDISRWSPSWANYEIVRYTLVDDELLIKQLADNGVNDFVYNIDTLKNAKGVAVLSYVKGKSGKLGQEKGEYASKRADSWEMFDAGIACQTFCLAAHAKGIGTCIMGVINEENISEIINLPSNETVAALVVYGYPESGSNSSSSSRKSVDQLLRFTN